jgi:RNA polymerase sigma factor (sigma-70 family)
MRNVRNRAFHHLRKSRRESLIGEESAALVTDNSEDTPDELIARMETVAELRQLLTQLPEKDQTLVQLKYYEGLKYRDISERTGLTISNVGFRLHQVLKRLAASLSPQGVENDS